MLARSSSLELSLARNCKINFTASCLLTVLSCTFEAGLVKVQGVSALLSHTSFNTVLSPKDWLYVSCPCLKVK